MKYRIVYTPGSMFCYHVEQRKNWFDYWHYVNHSVSKDMVEALAVVDKHRNTDMSPKYYYLSE